MTPIKTKKGTEVLGHGRIQTIVERLAHEIYEHHHTADEFILIGITGRGTDLRHRLGVILSSLTKAKIRTGECYVNKLKPMSEAIRLDLPLEDLKGKVVILVDDVLNSGRTLVHAMGYLITADPAFLRTVVLVDRIHRNFPIRADYVGLSLSTTIQERVEVEFGKEDYAYLV